MTTPATSHAAQAAADLVRAEWSRLLASLRSDLGSLELAEDVAQEALEVALARWPEQGVPSSPGAWITTVARRRAIDRLRRDRTQQDKLAMAARLEARAGTAYQPGESLLRDEQLQLIFGCCHPSLSIEAQMALTLRCVAGLSTREIASAFLVSESTMAQRLVRAKKKIETAAIPFRIPPDNELLSRSNVVLNVIYLIFNEGYTSAEGDTLVSFDLCHEAIRLGQLLTELLPEDPEPLGLVALMLLLDARRDARTDLNGDLVLLADQDRSLWNQTSIAEAGRLLDRALRLDRPGAYQLQAAINALHAEAPSIAATDWRQIEHLYGSLYVLQPTPVVALNHGVALAEAEGPQRGLDHLARVAEALDGYQYFHSARADLLRRLERPEDARAAYTRALELTTNEAERRFLTGRLAEL